MPVIRESRLNHRIIIKGRSMTEIQRATFQGYHQSWFSTLSSKVKIGDSSCRISLVCDITLCLSALVLVGGKTPAKPVGHSGIYLTHFQGFSGSWMADSTLIGFPDHHLILNPLQSPRHSVLPPSQLQDFA